MNKKLLFLTLITLSACSAPVLKNEKVTRNITSEKSHETTKEEYLDLKFESYWNGSLANEILHIKEVGTIISTFVKESAETRIKWFKEYDSLTKKPLREFSSLDKKKLIAYQNIFTDLPSREVGSFATRDVHRKDHGCYKAELKVSDTLDPIYEKGLFRKGENYDAVIRFSNGNPNNNSDDTPDARGMAVKLLPKGTLTDLTIGQLNPEKINREGLLDILTINFPIFFVNDPLIYAKINSYFLNNHADVLASNKLSEILSIFNGGMSNFEKLLALRVNGSIIANPLYQEWFSMAPSRLGASVFGTLKLRVPEL